MKESIIALIILTALIAIIMIGEALILIWVWPAIHNNFATPTNQLMFIDAIKLVLLINLLMSPLSLHYKKEE